MNLGSVSIRNPVFTTMVMLAFVVLGLFSFRRLNIDEMPDVEFPVILVQTVYPGASPEGVEREVTRPIEEAVNPVQHVDRITSYSLEGVSAVIIEFELEADVDVAAADVRAKLEEIRATLPTAIEPPAVLKFDINEQPILSLAVSSQTVPIGDLTTYADEVISPRLEAVTGIANVQILGGLAREIRVLLNPAQMEALGVGINDIAGALQRQNAEVPAGRIERGNEEQLIRITGRIERPEQFGEVIVAVRNGTPVYLRQVAEIVDATEEERSVAIVDGVRAVSLDLRKVSGANTVRVAEEVKEVVAELQETLPPGIDLRIVRDNSVFIEESVADVKLTLILGAVLTVAIVFLFLNDLRATTITALSLPVSVISAFIILDALGFTLNTLTLMALSLAIGILIDDAIVVIENIVRHRERGENAFEAAEKGTREIMLAVMATTFTTVAVFIPVAFMGGIVGRFFYQFGITVAWAVLVSLFVSFTLTPMLAAWWSDPEADEHRAAKKKRNAVSRAIGRFNDFFEAVAERYRGVIGWALERRKTTLGIATLAFVCAIALFPFIGGEFMPASDRSEFTVSFETPVGSSLAYTRSKADAVEAIVKQLPGVDYTYTTIGGGLLGGTVNEGLMMVRLVDPSKRKLSQEELMVEARRALAPLHGVEISVLQQAMGGAYKPIEANIRGPDLRELQRLSDELVAATRKVPGAIEVESSLSGAKPEYRIDVKRSVAADLGLDVGQIAMAVRPALAGQAVTTWEAPNGETYDVVVQMPADRRASVEDLERLPITAPRPDFTTGGMVVVPLGQVADIREGTGPAQIDRQRLQRVATVSANLAPGYAMAQVAKGVREAAAELDVPPGYSITVGGETEMFEETVGHVLSALLLAIILIYLILASQFGSFNQPFAIMFSLPLSLVGVMLGLLLTGSTMNMMSMIGVILLMGLVTKNAILLVDFTNELRASGKSRREALIEAGAIRLRPIMMTTLAMIMGMLPIALAIGQGAEFRAPMARAVIGGLITSTMLTLIVVPVAYTYLDDLAAWVKRRFVGEERIRELVAQEAAAGLARQPTWGGD